MVFLMDGFQVFGRNMGVNLSRSDVSMTQQGLNNSQVGATLQEVAGKGVAQGMRAHGLADACPESVLF